MALRHAYDLKEENVAWLAALMEPLTAEHEHEEVIKLLLYLTRAGRVQKDEIKQAYALVNRQRGQKGVLNMNWLDKDREEGEGIGALKILESMLTQRFGPLNEPLERQLRRLSFAQLLELSQQLFNFHSRKDLMVWLKQHGA